jgi:hypothetical protein
MDEVNGSVSDNRKVKIKLQPVLPVSVEFYCDCSRPPTLLPPPKATLQSDPPQYLHQCPNCKEEYILSHASGAIMHQKINNPDDAPKIAVVSRLPS